MQIWTGCHQESHTSLKPVARYLTSWLMKQLSWSWLSLPLIGSSSSDSVHFILDKRVKRKRPQNFHKHLPRIRSWPLDSNISKHPILTWSGYVVSNSTPKYWSIKFFFVQAEAALPSESVCRMENHISAWVTELICLHINQHLTPRGHKMKYDVRK